MDLNGYSVPDFIKEINGIVDEPVVLEDPGLDKLRTDMFYYQINNLDRMTEKDRFDFIKSNIDLIASQVMDGTCKYNGKLADPIFLNCVKEVLRTMPLTESRKRFVNKLAYSYQFYKRAIDSTQHLLLDAARVVNRQEIEGLKSVGLSDEDATKLAVARYSSFDEMENTFRLNHTIYSIGNKIMTEQRIIWVYEKLYDHMRYLFTACMLETKEICSADGYDEESYYETFSVASLSLLTIVNNMTSYDIESLIRIFVEQWTYHRKPRTRFSLRALSGDFGRVRGVVEYLYEKYNIYVP